jgi:hypothetical protein
LSVVGTRRTLMGSDGDIEVFEHHEHKMSEALKQLMYNLPFYDSLNSKYRLLEDAYYGKGGFANGDYLIPHPRENFDKYNRRKQLSYYTNYVKPVVDANVNPIFSQEPTRQNTDDLYSMFINDVDGTGTKLTSFMKKAAIQAKLLGVTFIVVDMEKIDENMIVTKKDVLDNRLYPYLYLVKPSQIEDWATNKFGKLIYIKYQLTSTTIDKDGNRVDSTETYIWTETMYKKIDGSGEATGENTIGAIPVIPVYGSVNTCDELMPNPPMLGIARTNLAIFNSSSEMREQIRSQAFSILTFPIDSNNDSYEDGETMKYGTADMLLYDGTSGATPQFITAPSTPSDVILKELNFMIQQIYRMACLKDTTGTSQYNVTGLAKEYDNQQLYQNILELAQNLQDAEYSIAKIFGMYTDHSYESISIVYNNQFGVTDPTEALNMATQSLALNICPEFNLQVKKQVIRAVLTNVNSDVINKTIADLEKQDTSYDPTIAGQGKIIQPVRN